MNLKKDDGRSSIQLFVPGCNLNGSLISQLLSSILFREMTITIEGGGIYFFPVVKKWGLRNRD
jgi:hypothetical protein